VHDPPLQSTAAVGAAATSPAPIPAERAPAARGGGVWAWTIALGAALWASLILATPWLASRSPGDDGRLEAAAFAYVIGSFVCHQRPERSFHLAGLPLPVCGRCTGVYVGAAIGAVLPLVRDWRRRVRVSVRGWRSVLTLAIVPMAASFVLEWLTPVPVSNLARAATGLVAGSAIALFVTTVPLGGPEVN
jgi:uncharacterized membrane protein